jgi:ornithine carbamoyltransferase
MSVTLKHRSLLELSDLTPQEIRSLLDLSHALKAEKKGGAASRRVAGKNICPIFEKTSTRTRCAFEVAAYDLGMGVTYLDPGGSQIGHKESIKDTARVLGRMYDAIEYRGSRNRSSMSWLGTPACRSTTRQASVSDADPRRFHDDGRARRKPLAKTAYCYLGDARNNLGNSPCSAVRRWGWTCASAPRALWPLEPVVARRAPRRRDPARITLLG